MRSDDRLGEEAGVQRRFQRCGHRRGLVCTYSASRTKRIHNDRTGKVFHTISKRVMSLFSRLIPHHETPNPTKRFTTCDRGDRLPLLRFRFRWFLLNEELLALPFDRWALLWRIKLEGPGYPFQISGCLTEIRLLWEGSRFGWRRWRSEDRPW